MAKTTSSSGKNPPPAPPVLETVPSEPALPAPLKPAFLIVGVGASAGGLSAFRELLQALPSDTGIGFIFIQHLDPAHTSTLPALLSKATVMPVGEAQDGQIVEPNHVYVIPPNTSLGILHGKLQLLPRQKTGHRPLPIDQFFSALAEDRDSQAIGVILSGTASDGTLGLKAIKAAGGITFAQDEQSAEYDGMPHSAIAAGCVDFVLPPTQIAAELAQMARHPYASRKLAEAGGITPEGENNLNKIFLLLRSRTGNDFTYYKHSTIERRLRRRMLLHKLERLPDYIKLLQQQPTEVDELFQEFLINVTSFFRDPDAFAALKQEIFPRLIDQHGPETPVRVWVPGCSSGEEAYTIAMLWLEFLNDQASMVPLQVFATDIDAPAIDKARLGIYPESIKENVESVRLQRFFVRLPNGYQISKSVRDLCVFAVQNLNKDPPFSRLDLISCRNLLIYLGPVLQKKVLRLFHYALRSPGFLMLGTSETVGEASDLFAPIDKPNRLYEKKLATALPKYDFPTQPDLVIPLPQRHPRAVATLEDIPPLLPLQQTAEQILLGRYVPPGVMIDQEMTILHLYGKTAPYLELGTGPASLNLMRIVHPDLLIEVRNAVKKALKQGKPSTQPAHLRRNTGQELAVQVQVIPVEPLKSSEKFLLVLFEALEADTRVGIDPAALPPVPSETASADENEKRVKALEDELRTTRDYMQAIIEDQEATNEEFKAANEEIQSTNEELQSTNEELETTKEELQSMNEELATVNEELENRNLALTQSNNDLTNILSSVDMAIIMLDRDLKIRLFTSMAKNLLNLIDSDIGRPLSDLKPKVAIPELDRLALQVIDRLTPISKEVRDPDGHWYSVRVRPYRTLNNQIDGAVIAFIGMDDSKEINRLRGLELPPSTGVGDFHEAMLRLSFEGQILSWDRGAAQLYGYTEGEALSMNLETLVPEDQREPTRQMLAHLKANGPFHSGQTQRLTKSGERVPIQLMASILYDESGQPSAVVTTERPLTAKPAPSETKR